MSVSAVGGNKNKIRTLYEWEEQVGIKTNNQPHHVGTWKHGESLDGTLLAV
jgi:hypothetical protein